MLGNATRKKIATQDWLTFVKKDPNPTQTWNRLRMHANRAMKDLQLLAHKLPSDKQDEIFNKNTIRGLIESIVSIGNYDDSRIALDSRKASLAAVLAETGINLSIRQYEILQKGTPSLSQPTIIQLRNSIGICNEIAYKLDLLRIEERGTTKNLQYLFDWNKIPGNDVYRIKELLKRIMNTEFLDLTEIKKDDSNKSIECLFEINGGWPYVAIFDLNVDTADLLIWEKEAGLREVKDFIAENEKDHIYIYERNPNKKR